MSSNFNCSYMTMSRLTYILFFFSFNRFIPMFQGFQRRRLKCESLRRTTTDAKWWQKLTWPLARWAKNGFPHWWCGISISLYHLTDLWKKYIKSTLYWTSASFNNCIIAVTKNRHFFNCPLLLYYKSKWAQILTAATWQWVD
jgi:hypothetical protein